VSLFLLTGASGVVGSAIVPALLAHTDAEILLLLRPGERGVAERLTRLSRFWRDHYPALDPRALAARVRACPGDIAEPALGLDDQTTALLRERCTHIIHCAASVRMNLPLDDARRSAVEPVAKILRLAEALPSLRKIEFVSTVGVGGRRTTPLPETWLDTPPRDFHNTYEAAKYEAEALVRKAVEAGMPATVHRPSMVIGDSQTGAVIHFQIFYFLCDFLSGRRTAWLYPALGAATLDTIPNDVVAHAIVTAAGDPSTAGRILHLCAGPSHAIALRTLRALVRSRFRAAGRLPRFLPNQELPVGVFMACLRALAPVMSPDIRRGLGTLPLYLDYLAGRQVFENSLSEQWMAAQNLRWPRVSSSIEHALDFYLGSRPRGGKSSTD
jgi:thioester reductase-like protein